MVDALSAVGGGGAWGLVGLVVVPDAGGEVSRRRLIRAASPGRVRALWRSRPSWPLQVQIVDSIHWWMRPRWPCRAGSSLRSGRSSWPPQRATSFEVLAGESFVCEEGVR